MENCTYIRTRDTNAYGMDVEKFIKSIEVKYKVDFTDINRWKDLVDRLHHATSDYKRILQGSKNRKRLIVKKILDQTTRLSPFQLTEYMLRTRSKWEHLQRRKKSRISYSNFDPELIPSYPTLEGETSAEDMKAHPNSEILVGESSRQTIKVDADATGGEALVASSQLPPLICLNQHKAISALGTKESYLSKTVSNQTTHLTESEIEEWSTTPPCIFIRSYPPDIIVQKMSPQQQTFSFSVVNFGTEYRNMRFMSITDVTPFKYFKILPATPVRLIPGISLRFKFIFKLHANLEDLHSSLCFRVSRNVLFGSPYESLVIPIRKIFFPKLVPIVPQVITLPPAYPWHINGKVGYPTGVLKLTNKSTFTYQLRITKRIPDFSEEYINSLKSVNAYSPDTQSIHERKGDYEVIEDTHNNLVKAEKDVDIQQVESLKTLDVILMIVEEIVENSLQTFTIGRSYLKMQPFSKAAIPIYFTKYEYIGLHQCYYDIEFSDANTDEKIITKSVQVHAEVLSHPIDICPKFLDISNRTVKHGYIKDRIVFYNNDKTFPVTVKLKLTKKMKKLFTFKPLEIVIDRKSSGFATITFCSSDFLYQKNTDELAYFTIKIVFRGHSSIYYNTPPVFYGIIAPCASEFKKVYNENFFKEIKDESVLEVIDFKNCIEFK